MDSNFLSAPLFSISYILKTLNFFSLQMQKRHGTLPIFLIMFLLETVILERCNRFTKIVLCKKNLKYMHSSLSDCSTEEKSMVIIEKKNRKILSNTGIFFWFRRKTSFFSFFYFYVFQT